MTPPNSAGDEHNRPLTVSVLVPTYNRANYLGECLDSLLDQTEPALEIIVIDDGSSDDTPTLAARYGERIRYVRKVNGGKPTAVNLGLSLAQGALIWIFDDDDVALPDAIAQRVRVLKAHPDAGFVFSPHWNGADGPGGKIERTTLHDTPNPAPQAFLHELMKGCFFHLATALVRREAYQAVGAFDTELLSSEDYDMQLRLAAACPASFCAEPTFIFRRHGGERGAAAIRYKGADRAKVFRRFDQRVGRKLRASLALGEYLVPRQQGEVAPSLQSRALLGRFAVMASKGCIPEMLEDLRGFLQLAPANASLKPEDVRSIAQAIRTGYAPNAIEDQWHEFLALIAALPRTRATRGAIRSLAYGLFQLAKGYPASLSKRGLRLRQCCTLVLRSL